jgi:hypothetical protein
VIGEFQSEVKAGMPRIIELLTNSDSSVRYNAMDTIKTLGQWGKKDENGK